jgi:hypothetical protein
LAVKNIILLDDGTSFVRVIILAINMFLVHINIQSFAFNPQKKIRILVPQKNFILKNSPYYQIPLTELT